MSALQVGVKGTVFHAEAEWLGEPKRIFVCVTEADLQGGNETALMPLSTSYHTALVGRGDQHNT